MNARSLSLFGAGALAGLGAASALAQDTVTLQSLLDQDFAVVAAITSSAGPGVFLQKKHELFVCFVAETPRSRTVTTRYCKPVR